MYWMELHVVVFILVLTQSASKGKTEHVLTDLGECLVRQWYGGHKDKLLLFNKVSRDSTKYEDRTNLSSTVFSLVIKHYTESDLNINYACSCGFKSYSKRLGLNDEDFIAPPFRVDTNIKQSNEVLSIYIHFERIYSRPQCSVVIGERTVFHNVTLKSVKRGVFYYGTYKASFDIVYDDCGKKPTLSCYIGNEYMIVNTFGEPIRNCTVYLIVSNKPVMYGDNIILTCKTGHVFKDKGVACRVRQWCSGHKQLLFNGVSIDATKYVERTNLSSTEFSLVIKNYNESDLNIDYTCSCDFYSYTKRLGLSDNTFIVPPLRMDTNIQQSNATLSIYIHVERVYPRPECYVVIGERTDSLTLTSVKHDVFYSATYEASLNLVADDCGKKPILLCYIGNEYTIVNTSGDPIRNCTVYWIVSNKPVMYGDNIILTCKTGDVLKDRRDACRVRQWCSGQKLLLYNGVPKDASKYENRKNVLATEFSLVIKHYTESDLNINYTCSCDFNSYTKLLGLSDNNFIVPPLRLDTYIQQSNGALSIYLHVERVYPRPECSIAIGERTVFDNLTFTSVKSDVFFNATYDASFNIEADDCDKKPTLSCYIGNEYNIVTTSGVPIRNCTEVRGDGGNTTGYNSISTEAYPAYSFIHILFILFMVVAIVVCFSHGVVILCERRSTCTSRPIQKEKGTLMTLINVSE